MLSQPLSRQNHSPRSSSPPPLKVSSPAETLLLKLLHRKDVQPQDHLHVFLIDYFREEGEPESGYTSSYWADETADDSSSNSPRNSLSIDSPASSLGPPTPSYSPPPTVPCDRTAEQESPPKSQRSFNVAKAIAQCKKIDGVVHFKDITGVGLPSGEEAPEPRTASKPWLKSLIGQ